MDVGAASMSLTEPSIHEIVQKATTSSWKKIRSDLRKAVIETNAMPLHMCCKLCSTSEATCQCLQCSPDAYFCTQCFEVAHMKAYFFHTGEVWEV